MDPSLLRTALGPLLIGGLVSTALYGVTCIQTFVYFQKSEGDRLLLKTLISTLWLLDTLDVVLNGHILYHYLVTNFANPFALTSPVWSLVLHVSITAITNFLVRGMFTRRVFRLSQGNWILTVFITAVSLLDLVCSVVVTVMAFHDTFAELMQLSTLLYLDFAAVFSADASIAVSLCYYLRVNRTGVRKTDSLINILMLYTVNTGLLTALDASAGLIMFAVMPNNLMYVAFYLQLSKLYVNAYLASLNARETLRDRTEDIVSIHLSRISNSRNRGTYADPPSQSSEPSSPVVLDKLRDPMVSIAVTTDVETRYENGYKRRSHSVEPGLRTF
ncbi:unnamed protein product [Somion occarium]|uniref:DUF6534 domain-containing protein n=1 Tax=Somion occarium TaxID=3059160 RepID=A0ABP1DVZ2_9APHY